MKNKERLYVHRAEEIAQVLGIKIPKQRNRARIGILKIVDWTKGKNLPEGCDGFPQKSNGQWWEVSKIKEWYADRRITDAGQAIIILPRQLKLGPRKPSQKICSFCGKLFFAYGASNSCSTECQIEMETPKKKCCVCDNEFDPKTAKNTCSQACKNLHQKKLRKRIDRTHFKKISDNYVAKSFRLPVSMMPPQLISTAREKIRLQRMLKTQQTTT